MSSTPAGKHWVLHELASLKKCEMTSGHVGLRTVPWQDKQSYNYKGSDANAGWVRAPDGVSKAQVSFSLISLPLSLALVWRLVFIPLNGRNDTETVIQEACSTERGL